MDASRRAAAQREWRDDTLLRARELTGVLGVGESTLWAWVRAGRFPPPIRLSARYTCWRWADVREWVAAQREQSAREAQ